MPACVCVTVCVCSRLYTVLSDLSRWCPGGGTPNDQHPRTDFIPTYLLSLVASLLFLSGQCRGEAIETKKQIDANGARPTLITFFRAASIFADDHTHTHTLRQCPSLSFSAVGVRVCVYVCGLTLGSNLFCAMMGAGSSRICLTRINCQGRKWWSGRLITLSPV